MTSSHYRKYQCLVANWILRNELQWNFDHNTKRSILENVFENAVSRMAGRFFRHQCAYVWKLDFWNFQFLDRYPMRNLYVWMTCFSWSIPGPRSCEREPRTCSRLPRWRIWRNCSSCWVRGEQTRQGLALLKLSQDKIVVNYPWFSNVASVWLAANQKLHLIIMVSYPCFILG